LKNKLKKKNQTESEKIVMKLYGKVGLTEQGRIIRQIFLKQGYYVIKEILSFIAA